MRRLEGVSGRLVPRTRRFVLGMLAVLAVAALIGMTIAVRAEAAAHARKNAEADSRAFAVEVVPKLLSYEFDTAEKHFAEVLDDLGGDFRGQFEEVSRSVILPSAVERKVVTTAEVLESAVVDSGTDDAVVLLFLNQSTTSSESPETKLDGSRVRVHVERSGSRWLITELTPV
ncbi:MAG: Mce-associated membrane protein [Rhodococcus sp. (in: high G+C Gram-positive bacteria)]|jgi:Mce-associated membrane protein